MKFLTGIRFKKNICPVFLCLLFLCAGCSGKGEDENDGRDDRKNAFQSALFSPSGMSPVPGMEFSLDVEAGVEDSVDEDYSGGGILISREIEEADIIKINGNFLYLLNRYKGLIICDMSTPDKPFIKGIVEITGTPAEMYIRDDRAYVLVSSAYFRAGSGAMTLDVAADENTGGSRVTVVDISDKTAPEVLATHDIEGGVTDSRIVGDILYVVSSQSGYYRDSKDTEKVLSDEPPPAEDQMNVSGVTEIACFDDTGYVFRNELFIVSIDVSNPDDIIDVDKQSLSGISPEHIHVTEKAIFVTSRMGFYDTDKTRITHIDISDEAGKILVRGSIDIKGGVFDRYKLDYYENYLRVCSFSWADLESYLYVIDASDPDNLVETGNAILGEGEQLFATRFDGERAYLVTYERVDPLWVVDLSDPASPEVKGELIVPGWSTYIEPKGDHLVALGIDDTGDYNKVAVSLFNVSDTSHPELVKRVALGDDTGGSSSQANYDFKALTVIDEIGLILVPLVVDGYKEGGYYQENRIQLVDFSKEDLNARGYIAQEGNISRSRLFSNRILSVSESELIVIDPSDRDAPVVTADIDFVTDIQSVKPLANGYGARLMRSMSGNYTLQSISLDNPEPGDKLGEISMGRDYNSMLAKGNLVLYIKTVYGESAISDAERNPFDSYYPYYEASTLLMIIDFSNPAEPYLRSEITVPGSNYRIRSEGGEGVGLSEILPGSNLILSVNDHTFAFVRSNYHSLSMAGNDYGDGSENFHESVDLKGRKTVFVVDVSNPDTPEKIIELELPLKETYGVFSKNNFLYYSYNDNPILSLKGYAETQFYLGRIDLTLPSVPVIHEPVNIPGICLATNDSGKVLYTVDFMWNKAPDGTIGPGVREDLYQINNLQFTFNSVELKENVAYLMDSIDLNNFVDEFVKMDDRFFFRSSGIGFTMVDAKDAATLSLTFFQVQVQKIFGIQNDTLFTGFFGISSRYTLNNDLDSLDLVSQKDGWVSDISFTDEKAYLSMGYEGIWVEDL